MEEQEEAKLQEELEREDEEREREEEERLLELKDEEYELLDEDSLQVNLHSFSYSALCLHFTRYFFLVAEHRSDDREGLEPDVDNSGLDCVPGGEPQKYLRRGRHHSVALLLHLRGWHEHQE